MANSSVEYWEIDGVSLHQYGWSVATVGGARYDLPPKRGQNIRTAYRPGALHRPKTPDERTVTLVMWVTGMVPGTGASTGDQILRFNDSWDFLRRLVWKPNGTQVTLTRRTRLTIGGTPQILVATAKAEVVDTMEPTMSGRTRADFVMSLLLSDPFYYGERIETDPMDVGESVAVWNPGYDVAAYGDLEIDLIGPLTDPVLTNSTPTPDVWVKVAGVTNTGQSIRLNVGAYTAIGLHDGSNVIWRVTHSGARTFMGLHPGTNLLQLTTSVPGQTGTAVVRFSPPYA